MFISREKEIDYLQKLYDSKKFEFLVLYGRRRVGKTELLKQFMLKNNSLFFSAQEQSVELNMFSFGEAMQKYFELSYTPKAENWKVLIDILSDLIKNRLIQKPNEKICIVIDEFPFIAKAYPAIKSILQHSIDHIWKELNIMLILCGSSVSFMINEVLGYSSPLYGRRTANLELKPLNYIDSAKFFPSFSNEDKILAYSILGGIPQYLQFFDDSKSFRENIKASIIMPGSQLNDEVNFLLKQEFREPALYNSILIAIATGATKLNQIATKIGEDRTKANRYISELREIRVIDKITPYNDDIKSRNSIYYICDNFFQFWYKYIFRHKSENILLSEDVIVDKIMADLSDNAGLVFEKICTDFLIKQAQDNKLPFIPNGLGKWWGNNPITKKEDDIDILGIKDNKGLFCECKFRNEKFDLQDLNDLIVASNIFTKTTEKYYYIFVKSGYTKSVIEESKKYNIKLLTIDDLFNIE